MKNLSMTEIAFVSGGFDKSAYDTGVKVGVGSGTTLAKGGKVIAVALAVALFIINV